MIADFVLENMQKYHSDVSWYILTKDEQKKSDMF